MSTPATPSCDGHASYAAHPTRQAVILFTVRSRSSRHVTILELSPQMDERRGLRVAARRPERVAIAMLQLYAPLVSARMALPQVPPLTKPLTVAERAVGPNGHLEA